MPRYHVLHETRYQYGSAVSLSQQILHLSPRACPWQRCLHFGLALEPGPTYEHVGEDAFGNPVTYLDFNLPHDCLHVRAEMTIDVLPHLPGGVDASIAWDALVARLAYRGGEPPPPADLVAKRFLFESPHVRIKHELADYARECFLPGRPVLAATQALMRKINAEFEFDPGATSVSTPVMEVLERKKGVCQDFAHLMIACLRALGLPARYVSGYLLTHPPPGKPRLVGADASHAWLSVYAPGTGSDWVDFDPTNDLLPDTEHITVAWGRDFSDVSPLRGVIVGGGDHDPEVAVTVTPVVA